MQVESLGSSTGILPELLAREVTASFISFLDWGTFSRFGGERETPATYPSDLRMCLPERIRRVKTQRHVHYSGRHEPRLRRGLWLQGQGDDPEHRQARR